MGVLLTTLLLSLTVAAAAPAPAPATVPAADERDVPYVERDGTALRLDVHRPARAPGRAPAVVLVHGGGFHSGTRARTERHARRLAAAGFVVANIDYRLTPVEEIRASGYDAGALAAQQDAAAAVRHVRAHAAALGVDPARIAIGGVSAGAITALNVAGRARGKARVHAAFAIAGYGPVADFGPGDPPMLLLHGTRDGAVPFARAQHTCEAARARGVVCRLVPIEGATHGLTGPRHADALAPRVARWLARR